MQILDTIQKDLDMVLEKAGSPRTAMAMLGRTREYKHLIVEFEKSIRKQIKAVVNDELFRVIHSKISKADNASDIFTESDLIEINESVQEEIAKHPTSDFISSLLVAGYMIHAFEKGGQEFLDIHNLPKTFKLTNENILKSISQKPPKLFQGLDETTSTWISDQIVDGKTNGIGTQDIIDSITEQLPNYPGYRAERIVRTETASMVSESEQITAEKNGASHKEWEIRSEESCDECQENADAGMIGIQSAFPSGAYNPPAHPNCGCITNYQFTPFMGFIWAGE